MTTQSAICAHGHLVREILTNLFSPDGVDIWFDESLLKV